jgi:hypothetical protein
MHSKEFGVTLLSTTIIAELCSGGPKVWSNILLDLNTIQNELVRRLDIYF